MIFNKIIIQFVKQATGTCFEMPLNTVNCKEFGFLVKRTMSMSDTEQIVLADIMNNKGIMTLNKPKKLNALNRMTLDSILYNLIEWENKVEMVIIKGEGRAFCAGGDIVNITTKAGGNRQKRKENFKIQYIINGLISQYPVPYVALIDGITMGGGVGLSVHGLVRIATERTLFAMPETRIGLFTDIGIGHIFSRMPHHLGYYLALCGHRLKGTDVVKAGIATHYTKSENIPSILKGLVEMKEPTKNLNNFLLKHTRDLNDIEFSLNPQLDLIDRTFSAPTVEEIIKRLQNESSEFALQALNLLKQMSPTSLKINKRLIDLYKNMTLEEGLVFDNRLSTSAIDAKITSDFYEGARALLIDKDHDPKWNPATLEQVPKELVEKAFEQLPNEEELNMISTLNEFRKKLKF